MTVDSSPLAALPFFLAAGDGERFCLYHEPNPGVPPRGAVLYVHPFAEEMNKSRRMVALQARAFTQSGFGVMQIDLYGCGDSSGDLRQASWDLWLADLARARNWLEQRDHGPCYVWGLRLGALLALDHARKSHPAGLILWQPSLSGGAYLNQFARLQSAGRLFSDSPAVEQDTEIAGYRISPSLSTTIRQLDAASMPPRCPVQWLELNIQPRDAAGMYAEAAGATASLQPASALLVERWREEGATVHAQAVHGDPFWMSTEIGISRALLEATSIPMEHQ
ncbi:hydrolase 2, exosortase A system-associated [Duganella sp. sic0402]|uniref:hydrolase 2, exosortase A system-associated n=1 Tax=Duganella sp. sic0402 TaxID=2854786 RepID=UPI001C482A12|nr:hydrolase 2, exosortase A system-associated [Duganella sp. sic0402]MBV7534778.1 hydrolase 2, exosortase A system-associated [Duganella sp. sic0402]